MQTGLFIMYVEYIYKHIIINQLNPRISMNISRILPFLPLLLLLPATSSAVIRIPSSHLNPSDLCPLVQIVEHELCNNHVTNANAKNLSDLCVLLHNYNASFCSKSHVPSNSHSDDVLSIRILENEFKEEEGEHDTKDTHKIRKVCPIINFIEEELCTSRTNPADFQFYPKQLCPLLNFTYTELCESLP